MSRQVDIQIGTVTINNDNTIVPVNGPIMPCTTQTAT